MAEQKIAAIRLKGEIGMNHEIKTSLSNLRLHKKNYCVVVPNTSSYLGMLQKIKDVVTWGEINDETFNLVVEKRGEEFKGREIDKHKKITYKDFFVFNNKKYKKYFRLNSPAKGYGRKGLKYSFKNGGALGYRGNKINDLIKRML